MSKISLRPSILWVSLISAFVIYGTSFEGALALKSDRNQPALVDADEVDMDFATGQRDYRGNVLVRQGTLRIEADTITTLHKDGILQKATAFGKPAIFKQRPDGKNHDVIGKGLRLELDHANDIITLEGDASIEQNQDSIKGETIVYNMATDQLKVRGGTKIESHTASPSASTADQGTQDTKQVETTTTTDSETGSQRSRIIIQPKQKTAPSAN